MGKQGIPTPEVPVETVPPETLYARIAAGEDVTILDTQSEASYAAWHIDGPTVDSINIPYTAFLEDDLGQEIHEQLPADTELFVLCAKGISSEYAASRLTAAGYEARHVADGMEGWARVFEATPVTDYEGPGTVLQCHRPSSGCLSYLICDGDEAAVVDPLRAFTDRYRTAAADRGATLTYAIDTHVHADHVSGVRALTATSVEGVLPAGAIDRGVADPATFTAIEDGTQLQVGEVTIEAVATPGHTSGMTSYRVGGQLLLTGDGLFVDSVARPDLEVGADGAPAAARQLYATLHDRILSLPERTIIAGGHIAPGMRATADGTYTARLGALQEQLGLLSLSEAAFVDAVVSDMPPRPANYATIIETNLGHHDPGPEEAFELELGPNNCAVSPDPVAGD